MSAFGDSSKGKESTDCVDVEDLLFDAQVGVRRLKEKVNKLQRENASLRDELERDSVLTSQPKPLGSTTDDDTNLEELSERGLEKELKGLKQTVSKVNKENIKLRKEIEDLRKSSLEQEVDELQTAKVLDEEVDPVYRMRKLLRRFSHLMLVSTTSDDMKEECPICREPFKAKESSALLCGHLICHVCVPKILRAATRDTEEIRCPLCRRCTPREELELVHMTETDRWDELTKVAQAWLAFDRPRELESSEEEDEENFITDGNGTSSEATSEAENNDDQTMDDAQDSPAEEPEGSRPPPPDCASGLLFSDSPSKLKRKRMEELAMERSQRKKT